MVQVAVVVFLFLLFIVWCIGQIFRWASENLELVIGVSILILIMVGIFLVEKRKARIAMQKKEAAEALERRLRWQRRQQELMDKYQDFEVVEKINNHEVWIGQTEEQLLDAKGYPEDEDRKLSQRKSVEIWKYHPGSRAGTFKLRITLTDGVVTAFNDKT